MSVLQGAWSRTAAGLRARLGAGHCCTHRSGCVCQGSSLPYWCRPFFQDIQDMYDRALANQVSLHLCECEAGGWCHLALRRCLLLLASRILDPQQTPAGGGHRDQEAGQPLASWLP